VCVLLRGGYPWLLTGISRRAVGQPSFYGWRSPCSAWQIRFYYKVFLDHIHLSLFEDGGGFNPKLLLSSFARGTRMAVFWIAVMGPPEAGCAGMPPDSDREKRVQGGPGRIGMALAAVLFYSAGFTGIFSAHPILQSERKSGLVVSLRDWRRGSLLTCGGGRNRRSAHTAWSPPRQQPDRDPRMIA